VGVATVEWEGLRLSGEIAVRAPRGGADGPRPLVVLLHADGADPGELLLGRRLTRLADAHGLLLAAVGSPFSEGSACWWTPHKHGQAALLDAAVGQLLAGWDVDRSRIVLAGMSGGAFLGAGVPVYGTSGWRGGVVGVCGGDLPRADSATDWCAVDETQDDPPIPIPDGALDDWSLFLATTRGDPWRENASQAAAGWAAHGRPVALVEAGRGGHCALDVDAWLARGVAWSLGLPLR
jgi:poly(3-hydroxybutyrate) depolymerase